MLTEAPIRYVLSIPAPSTHAVEVEVVLPVASAGTVELFMPSWIPGYYKIQDYAAQVESVRVLAPSDPGVELAKTAKNRWRVRTTGAGDVRLAYRLHAGELSSVTSFAGSSFAFLNGAATFLGVAGATDHACTVEVRPADGWSAVVSPLGEPGKGFTFQAAGFHQLVDSPVYAGNPVIRSFQLDGVSHFLVCEGEGDRWDLDVALRDVERIVAASAALWGCIPYERYVFFNLIVGGYGGLEHGASSVLLTGPDTMQDRGDYLAWLRLVAHEHFHAWNGRYLRHSDLCTPDYDREVYTRELWIVEGITSYYDHLLLHRAGLSRSDELLQHMSQILRRIQDTPGRAAQTLEESSFDAWIRFFRPDENTFNTTVSFYLKGALVAWLLDVALRRESGGALSLDDILREACRRFAGGPGLEPGAFERLAVELSGSRWVADLLDLCLRTTNEIDWTWALDWLGLELQADPGSASWLGAETEARAGRVWIKKIHRESPAYRSGLSLNDEILALGGRSMPPEGPGSLLRAFRPGEQVDIVVARRKRVLSLPVVLGERSRAPWRLAVAGNPDPAQRRHLADWLSGSAGGRPHVAGSAVTGRHCST